jgi:threonine dehydrogenase-like Zn-dependent dehydrogenase
MRAAVWNDHGTLDIVERPDPEPRPGWARIKVAAVGICGTDLHFFRGGFPSPAGLLPGHEVSGTVDAAGDGIDLAAGTPVAVEPITGCGTCAQCLTGNYTRCSKRVLFGVSGRGGMAELATFPAKCLYPLPDSLPLEAGALVEPLAVCVRGARLGGITPGDRVAILGAGTIGLMSILTARQAGASEVVITARHPAQAEAARALGADAVFASAEDAAKALAGAPVDVVIETVGGKSSTMGEAVALASPGAKIAMLGVFEGHTRLPALDVSTKELTIVGSNCYARHGARTDFEIAIDLLARTLPQLEPLVTHRFGLDDANKAFETAADKATGSIKVQVRP